MNNSQQALNGFKTFIMTLSVSLLLFGVVYYVATYDTAGTFDIESGVEAEAATGETYASVPEGTTRESPFADLNRPRPDVEQPAVLGGSDATPSTVPETGTDNITFFLFISMIITTLGAYLLVFAPRQRALENFERRIRNKVD
jgi:uncharacterized surface anchored protein